MLQIIFKNLNKNHVSLELYHTLDSVFNIFEHNVCSASMGEHLIFLKNIVGMVCYLLMSNKDYFEDIEVNVKLVIWCQEVIICKGQMLE